MLHRLHVAYLPHHSLQRGASTHDHNRHDCGHPRHRHPVSAVQIIHQRTGALVESFDDYVAAATYRRDVLRPQLDPTAQCPYAIRTVDQGGNDADLDEQ